MFLSYYCFQRKKMCLCFKCSKVKQSKMNFNRTNLRLLKFFILFQVLLLVNFYPFFFLTQVIISFQHFAPKKCNFQSIKDRFHLSFWIWKVWKGKKLQKFEYLKNEKSFLAEIKTIFHSYWRAIIWWKQK